MRYVPALAGFFLIAAPAAAQMYPGQDVTVNPGAAGTQVLLYPGGQFARILPPLRQPGATDAPIRLHLPTRHHHRDLTQDHQIAQDHHTAPQAPPPTIVPRRQAKASPQAAAPVAASPVASLPPLTDFGDFMVERPTAPTSAKPKPEPAPRRVVQHAVPPPQRTASSDAPVVQRMAPIEPPPVRHTTPVETPQSVTPVEPPVQHTAPAETPPQRVASVAPPPVRTPPPARLSTRATTPEIPSGNKRGVILFAPNADDPTVAAMQTVKSLAGELSTALSNGTSRVQLLAYGGPHGDKSSDTRRLSLKRALIVRQVLIDQGVPAERIDVRAMGGTDDSGPLDRVDVFVKS